MGEIKSKKSIKGLYNNFKSTHDMGFYRNLLYFSLGTVGRDFLYSLFNMFLMTFILFTKTIDDKMLTVIGIIIVVARIFDALNDPLMGGIVANTRSKWGKYKPWQLLGAILTGGVIISVYCVNLDGWAFVGFLAGAYFMFSITFTMNDISYWGMMPTLTSDDKQRSQLMSFAQLCASAGSGLASLLIPLFTTGTLAKWGAPTGYKFISIFCTVLMILFQLFTILGVKEKPESMLSQSAERLTVKDMFKTIAKNDQLLWTTVVMLIYCIASGIIGSALTMYIYFEFGYEGSFTLYIGIGYSIVSTLFTILYPYLSGKFGRNKILYSTGIALVLGYVLMTIFGLVLPTGARGTGAWFAKYILMTIAYTLVGYGGGFYMIMVINMANTVEYNEWKTGKRQESLIFSLRPFTAKMGSAITQGVVMLIYIIANVTAYTNKISAIENNASRGSITNEQKMADIGNVISEVSSNSRMILLSCICLIPALFVIIALIIYKKKCFLDEHTLQNMQNEIKERREKEISASEN